MILMAWFRALRHKYFELFYYTHHLFLLVFAGAIAHTILIQNFATDLGLYYFLPGLLLYLIDKILRITHSKVPVDLVSLNKHSIIDGGITQVSL